MRLLCRSRLAERELSKRGKLAPMPLRLSGATDQFPRARSEASNEHLVIMSGETGAIILCEPQCLGFEHASFNAALLQTVLAAFPAAKVVFMAEKAHLACVREKLAEATGSLDRVAAWL